MRKFLVVMDDTDEWVTALQFACVRAARTGGGVEVLAVIAPEEFQHWIGVGEVMRAEARQKIEDDFARISKQIVSEANIEPHLVIREGVRVEQVLAQIEDDQEIGVLVLAAGNSKDGPGPLINNLVGRRSDKMRVPITVIPWQMSYENICAVC